jgi:hypothetical protein
MRIDVGVFMIVPFVAGAFPAACRSVRDGRRQVRWTCVGGAPLFMTIRGVSRGLEGSAGGPRV